jgi:hypothetical protein
MTAQTKRNHALGLLVAASLVASSATLLITIFPPTIKANVYLQSQLIGSVFAVICAGGGAAALFPARCTSASEAHTFQSISESGANGESQLTVRGHHPDCGRFSAHIVEFKGTVYCAACSGLLAGALIALTATIFYFFLGVGFNGASLIAVIFGQAGIMFGFIQFKFKGLLRLLANLFFVVGGSLTVIGTDAYLHSLFVDLFVVGAILLWIVTRITISQWNHSTICASCGFACKRERKER